MKRKLFYFVLGTLIVLSLVLAACGPAATPTEAPPEPTEEPERRGEDPRGRHPDRVRSGIYAWLHRLTVPSRRKVAEVSPGAVRR